MKKLFQSFPDVVVAAHRADNEKISHPLSVPAPIITQEPAVDKMLVVEKEISSDAMLDFMKVVKDRKLLTSTPRKHQISLDHVPFRPTVTTYLSGKNFKSVYRHQLQQHLLDAQNTDNPEAALSLSQVFSETIKHDDGLQLTSKAYKRKLIEAIQVLNEFFRTNSFLLYNICGLMGEAPKLNIPTNETSSVPRQPEKPDTEFTFSHD